MNKYILILLLLLSKSITSNAQDSSWMNTLTKIVNELSLKYKSDTLQNEKFGFSILEHEHIFYGCSTSADEVGLIKCYYGTTWYYKGKGRQDRFGWDMGCHKKYSIDIDIQSFVFHDRDEAIREKNMLILCGPK